MAGITSWARAGAITDARRAIDKSAAKITLPLMKTLISALFLVCSAISGSAHELWLEAEEWQVSAGAPMRLHMRNGEKLKGLDLAWFENRIDRLEQIAGGEVVPIQGRMGDVPAVQVNAVAGLNVVLYQSPPSKLTYDSWAKFENFLNHKDLAWAFDVHAARGWAEEGVTELYTRHVKALVSAGVGGADGPAGMETEFVALADPYGRAMAAMPVQLFYQGKPRADAQIEVFARDGAGEVTVSLARTDAEGRADIPVTAGHMYLLDAVVLREAPPESGVQWESLWAALTFAVP